MKYAFEAIPPFSEEEQSDFNRYMEVLSKEDDFGAVIRVHTLIERALVRFIRATVRKPDHFSGRHHFEVLVDLVMMLGFAEHWKGLLKRIGSLRNEFAQRDRRDLESKDFADLFGTMTPNMRHRLKKLEEEYKFERTLDDARPKIILCFLVVYSDLITEIKLIRLGIFTDEYHKSHFPT